MTTFRSEFRRLLTEQRPIGDLLQAFCREIERRIPDARCMALVQNRHDRRVQAVASSLPPDYLAATEAAAGEPTAPFSLARASRRLAIFAELARDPRWGALGRAALRQGLHSAWFAPIASLTGEPVGLFAIHRAAECAPTAQERAALRPLARLAAIAVRRESLHEESREAGARLKNLVANLPGMVFQWTFGPDGALVLPFVSDSATALTGLSAEAVAAAPRRLLHRIARSDRARLFAALRHSVEALEPVTEDFRFVRSPGDSRWVRITSRPRRKCRGVISDALGLDISDLQLAEETLRRSEAELNDRLLELHRANARLESQGAVLMETARELTAARDSAEQASHAKSEFLSNMSHELRTPLNAIIGFSEILKEQTFGPVGSPKYREYASDIHESGLHLLELINEILAYAKIEAGKEELSEEAFDFAEAAASTVRMVHERAERGGVGLERRIPDGLPLLRADKRKIRQILLNLLSNAIKFTERGGQVTMTAWCADPGGFVIQVSDTGIGIALADIPKALGLFGQIDSAFSRRHEGTGLGLPLTKALVELHGGSLDLQSQPGVGTTVTVRLPAERIVPGTAHARTAGAA